MTLVKIFEKFLYNEWDFVTKRIEILFYIYFPLKQNIEHCNRLKIYKVIKD